MPARQLGTFAPLTQNRRAFDTLLGPLPTVVQLAEPIRALEVPRGPDWLHEMHFGGTRCVACLTKSSVSLADSQGDEFTQYAEPAARTLRLWNLESAMIDGMLLPKLFAVFDLLYLDGTDLRGLPLEQRKAILIKLFRAAPSRRGLLFVPHVHGRGDLVMTTAKRSGAIGVVSKRAQSVYPEGHTNVWRFTSCR